jgi:hypothetical protein
MTNSEQSDIVSNIIKRALNEFENSDAEYNNCADKLRAGLDSGKLKNAEWVFEVMAKDIDQS